MQAATRGDGLQGEDVTHNVKHISGLLESLPEGERDLPGSFTVRGEVYISNGDFETLNAERLKGGLEGFSNARNAAVGSLRHLDPAVAARRRLSFAAFELIECNGRPKLHPACSSHAAGISMLESLGFSTLQSYSRVVRGIEGAVGAGQALLERRSELPFQIDGCVIKLNCLEVCHADIWKCSVCMHIRSTESEPGPVCDEPRPWDIRGLIGRPVLLSLHQGGGICM